MKLKSLLRLTVRLFTYTIILTSCGVATGGQVGHLTAKKLPKKSGKRGRKSGKGGKKREKSEKRGKIGKVLSLCPSWQIGLVTLLLMVIPWRWPSWGTFSGVTHPKIGGILTRGTRTSAVEHWTRDPKVVRFKPRVGPHVVSLSKSLYSNLLLSTQVYKWVPAKLGR